MTHIEIFEAAKIDARQQYTGTGFEVFAWASEFKDAGCSLGEFDTRQEAIEFAKQQSRSLCASFHNAEIIPFEVCNG